MAQLVTVATLVMVMAMLAPGYAARVLGIQAENAVIVFAPAGIGMLIATGIVGRWGYRLRRIGGGVIGLVLTGLTFAAMGWVSQDYQRLLQPILHVYPRATLSLTSATMGLCLVLGMSLASVNILGQTTLTTGVAVQHPRPGLLGAVHAQQPDRYPADAGAGRYCRCCRHPTRDGDRRPRRDSHGFRQRRPTTRARKVASRRIRSD